MAIVRYLLAIAFGGAVTFGLLFLMQALVASGRAAITDKIQGRVIEFVRVKKEETVERKNIKPSKPRAPEQPPPDMPEPQNNSDYDDKGGEPLIIPPAPVVSTNVDVGDGMTPGLSMGASDGEYLPIVKVKPVYPPAALNRKIEGWVIIEFTVTKNGSVKDPSVVEYHPLPIFNKAALKAALKFKYKPRVVNGEPIEVRGVRNKIIFKITDNN